MTEPNRELGPEMVAEGWIVIGGDWIIWCHRPTHQIVKVEGSEKRSVYRNGWSMAPGEPETPEVYAVSRFRATEDGEPCDDDWDGFLTASYATALKAARATRERILTGKPQVKPSTQLTFDDLLKRNRGES